MTTETTKQLAKHFREIFFGGNWTCSCLKDNLKGVNWQMANAKIYNFNSIATLTCHVSYYITVLKDVLEGKPLQGKDELSFTLPVVNIEKDWEEFIENIWQKVERVSLLIERLPDSQLSEKFWDAKYGTYYRNISGVIEHTHYHLGQIVLIKKMLIENKSK